MINKKILVTRNVRGKLRLMEIIGTFDNFKNEGIIERVTYQFGGKRTNQPTSVINYGKAGRSNFEQYDLELKSLINKNLDKGYKIVPTEIDHTVEKELDDFYPSVVTDAKGFKKHMNAKDFNKVSSSALERPEMWYCSRKIDGVRCSFYLDDLGQIVTSSRGGKDYNVSTRHLRENQKLIDLFDKYPELILDGELYIHGKDLNYISGLSRIKTPEDTRYEQLDYYIFDVMDDSLPFKDRINTLKDIASVLDIEDVSFDNFDPDIDSPFLVLPHEEVSGWLQIKKKHDQYVEEGFEGCVIRNPDKKYRFGGRTNDMIKVKEYQDDEFKIIGWEEGKRGIEDMVFICKTETGDEFKAKPHGSLSVKKDYVNNMSNIIGKMATVKYFMISEYGVPQQPTLKCIRDYE